MPSETTSYDQVPYNSVAFPQTHPDRLATMARIFGVSTPDIAACRVLELGCASGGNLIPMAFNLPHSAFVGVDLSRHQVDHGRSVIRELGLSNIRIEHASILDVGPDFGAFDYIICHGVFSWVDERVQEKILQIASDHLSASGVAYISYNTYPGWHMREGVRRMMRYHTRQFDEPQEQIDQARALLAFLASSSEGSGPYGELLAVEIERLKRATDSYLFHEHLEQTNTPIYFFEFIERAERAGLMFLSEASISNMLSSHFQRPVAETLERISPDILQLEQYMDFVRNRQFRQTLLVHDSIKPKRALTPAVLHGLLVSSRALAETMPVDLSDGTTSVFSSGKQRADVSLPASKAAFAILGEAWPCALDVNELTVRAVERAGPYLGAASVTEAHRSLKGDLFSGVMGGMVQLHTHSPVCATRVSERPRASALAVYQARCGNTVVNAHHEPLEFDALSIEVIKLADGQRRRSDILETLFDGFQRGALVIREGDTRMSDPGVARRTLSETLEKALTNLARRAVLVD